MKITPKTVKTVIEILILAGQGISNAVRKRRERKREKREDRREIPEPCECETCEEECVHKP